MQKGIEPNTLKGVRYKLAQVLLLSAAVERRQDVFLNNDQGRSYVET